MTEEFASWGGAAREFATHRRRACTSKTRYRTMAEALRHKPAKERQYSRRLFIYRCVFCDAYHHTSEEVA